MSVTTVNKYPIFLGDVHGNWECLSQFAHRLDGQLNNIAVVQVGDFGMYPQLIKNWKPFPFPVYTIRGNHEDHRWLQSIVSKHPAHSTIEIAPNLFYVIDGTVIDFIDPETNNKTRCGFLGGASSVDQTYNPGWQPEEAVSEDAINTLGFASENVPLDILVAHSPPDHVINETVGHLNLTYWNLPHDWVDKSAQRVAFAWGMLGSARMVCGHLHVSYTAYYDWSPTGAIHKPAHRICHVLNIDEFRDIKIHY